MFNLNTTSMKKNVWLLGVAVAALTSCTQNEVLDVPESKKISFEAFVEKNTRAVNDIDAPSKLYDFKVFGYSTDDDWSNYEEVFSGDEELEYDNDDNVWIPTNESDKRLWKYGRVYRFAAYSNGNDIHPSVSYNPGTDKLTIPDYIVYDNEGASSNPPKDLLASIAGDKVAPNSPNFLFRHLLSKITVHITNASTNAEFVVEDAKINKMFTTGDCVCTYGTGNDGYPNNVVWTTKGVNTTPFKLGQGSVSTGHGAELFTFYVLPQDNTNIQLELSWDEKINSESHYPQIKTFSLASGDTKVPGGIKNNEWVPGYHYRYTLTKGTTFGEITFTASVETWKKDLNGDGEEQSGTDDVPLTEAQNP